MGTTERGQSRPFIHPDPVTDSALDWYARLREEATNPAVRAAFDQWLGQDPGNAEAYGRLELLYAMPALEEATRRDASKLEAAPPHGAMPVSTTARKRRPIAAFHALAAVAIAAIVAYQLPTILLHLQADHLTGVGERGDVLLPDGSVVVLNTDSAIDVDFDGGRRRVALLQGEAYFDVKRDEQSPFVVAGAFSEVEVKGTAFSVRRDENADVVVLARGEVEVALDADRSVHVLLRPGEEVVATAHQLSSVAAVDAMERLAWRDGRLELHDTPFRDAIAEMRRYYGGTVVIATSRLDGVATNGSYRLDDPLLAIRTMTEASGGSVTELPGLIILR